MGAWGTGVSSNDTYEDVYQQFIDLYNDGASVPEITQALLNEYQETINIEEDAPNFWFALAKAQWECKELGLDVFNKVKTLIESGEDLRVWRELGATQADIKAREKVLQKFLIKLQTEKEKPRKRVKKKFYSSIFKKGDCLVYIMDNGNYGGAFVLTDEENTEGGINYIANTTIDNSSKPTISDFESANIYVQRFNKTIIEDQQLKQRWVDKPDIGACLALNFKYAGIDIEVIGNLPILNDYRHEVRTYFSWARLKITIPFKEEYARINGEAKLTLKLAEWTKKKGWLNKIFGRKIP